MKWTCAHSAAQRSIVSSSEEEEEVGAIDEPPASSPAPAPAGSESGDVDWRRSGTEERVTEGAPCWTDGASCVVEGASCVRRRKREWGSDAAGGSSHGTCGEPRF